MPNANLYLVTKHFGEGMMHHCGKPLATLRDAKDAAKRMTSKGRFRPKAVVRIWKIVSETEVTNAKR